MPSVLWWGRGDFTYSRNRLVLKLFEKLGWSTSVFRPFSSRTGLMEAGLRRLERPDLIWVPCFRHRDVGSAKHFADKWRIPLIFDPLISAFQKEVGEREKWPADSRMARKRRQWESQIMAAADLIVADTQAHAEYFHRELNVPVDKTAVLYVGAESGLFSKRPFPPISGELEVLFYGSFLRLQGAEVIAEAANRCGSAKVKWTLMGEGDLKAAAVAAARSNAQVVFEPWIPFERLPERMERAHVLLGVFGTTEKADLVIPNKMFQSMAIGRPVITRYATAYRDSLKDSDVIGWVPPGDPEALSQCVRKWAADPGGLALRGERTRKLYDTYFSEAVLEKTLAGILDRVLATPTIVRGQCFL